MTKMIDGLCYKNMIDYGIRNLNLHHKLVNQLNVFPVPDGDTGTNMLTTVQRGFGSVEDTLSDLPSVSRKFANSIVFEARGNSGVILSQFFKGVSETFYEVDGADARLFIEALERGVVCAHSAVANPVEGTMLTVLREATEAVHKEFEVQKCGIDEIISSFVEHAKVSLDNTPNLLPTLQKAGVVDSGGAGIVYLFEGMKKYFAGEDLDNVEVEESMTAQVDYTAFNRQSHFKYGYCTELLIQLLDEKAEFVYDDFKETLIQMGDSVVTSFDTDKVRIHIHTHTPHEILAFCQQYGEFLSLKIENMTVQHTEIQKKILCAKEMNEGTFSVVAVANDYSIQNLLVDMGADVVICCEDVASPKDYIDAFEHVSTEHILVFPNSSDSILSAIQAKNMYDKASITVLNSRCIAECYASLPTIDFENENVEEIADAVTEIINNLYTVSVCQRETPIVYDNNDIGRNEFYAFSGKQILAIGRTLEETVVETIDLVVNKQNKEIITIFHGTGIQEEQIETMVALVEGRGICAEIYKVQAEKSPNALTIAFE